MTLDELRYTHIEDKKSAALFRMEVLMMTIFLPLAQQVPGAYTGNFRYNKNKITLMQHTHIQDG